MIIELSNPTVLSYFASLVKYDSDFPLLESAINLGYMNTPQLDVQSVLLQVECLQQKLQKRYDEDTPHLQRLRILNQFFYNEMGMTGSINNFHKESSSYIHQVLHTQKGNPISLAVLWLELAQAMGLNVKGVDFPGHFMVKLSLQSGHVIINPLTGESFSREDLLEHLSSLNLSTLINTDQFNPLERALNILLQAAKPRDVLERMLNILKHHHKDNSNTLKLLQTLDRLVILQPKGWSYYRERGLVHVKLGQISHAIEDLNLYLTHENKNDEAQIIRELLAHLQN